MSLDHRVPRVSVVIKAYNHAPFVGQAIESVLSQSLQDFEIVIIDDGSSDGTPDVIAGYAAADPRIHFEAWPSNRGLSIAMNAVLARARGPHVAILNSDDYALPGRLEKQAAYLDAHPEAEALFTLPQLVDDAGAPLPGDGPFKPPLGFPDFRPATWLRFFFLKGNCVCAPSAMVRREAYARSGNYDPRFTNLQDFDFWLRIVAGLGPRGTPGPRHKPAELHVLSERLTAFRMRARNANLSGTRKDTKLRTQFEWSRILNRFLELDDAFLRTVFNLDGGSLPKHRWLTDMALRANSPAHRLFAVETLHDRAATEADFARLREVSGNVDIFGIGRDR